VGFTIFSPLGIASLRAAKPSRNQKRISPKEIASLRAANPFGGAKENQGKTFPCGNRLESEIPFSLKQAWRKRNFAFKNELRSFFP